MHRTDICLISRRQIGNGAILERVVNRAGVPYSAILMRGYEVASAPTKDEREMLEWWRQEGIEIWKKWKPSYKKERT